MGNTTGLPQSDARNLLQDLSNSYLFHSVLGGSRVLKTFQCLCDEGYVVVKVYQKRDVFSLAKYQAVFEELRDKLLKKGCVCLMPFQRFYESEKAGFLVRQYFNFNLYDRFSAHPFLSMLEKKWVAYQILQILKQLQSANVCHGDIKSENIMVTSWNWLFLADFSLFKPTFLPDDNPADFSYYFQSTRSSCYVAPERFYKPLGARREAPLDSKMDIFSAGCVIAETFLEGETLFDLSQLLSYRQTKVAADIAAGVAPVMSSQKRHSYSHTGYGGNHKTFVNTDSNLTTLREDVVEDGATSIYDPMILLRKISDPVVVQLITSMIQVDPKKRLTAEQYLEEYTKSFFPDYFPYMYESLQTLLSAEYSQPDSKIHFINKNFPEILQRVCGISVPGAFVPTEFNESYHRINSQDEYGGNFNRTKSVVVKNKIKSSNISSAGNVDIGNDTLLRRASKTLLEMQKGSVETKLNPNEFDSDSSDSEDMYHSKKSVSINDLQILVSKLKDDATLFQSVSPAANTVSSEECISTVLSKVPLLKTKMQHSHQGLSIFIAVLCSNFRNVRYPLTKIKTIELLQSFGLYVDDEIRLGRIVPYLVSGLSDESALVRSISIHALTNILAAVKSLPESDTNIFPDYLLPMLSSLPLDQEEIVRVSLAQNIARISEIARTFLDLAHIGVSGRFSLSKNVSNHMGNYDSELNLLQDSFSKLVVDLITGSSSSGARIKQAFLGDITRLCVFFGRSKANNFLLPLLITVLNDRDWLLRATFFEHICGVAVYLGRVSLQNFILPCLEQALYDVEEFVVVRSIQAMSTLCLLGLFDTSTLLKYAPKVSILLCHPSGWIRSCTIELIVALAERLGSAKTFCFVMPFILPFLNRPYPVILNQSTLTISIRPPLSRNKFDEALRTLKDSNVDPMELLEKFSSNLQRNSDRLNLFDRLNYLLSADAAEEDDEVFIHMLKYIAHVAAALRQKTILWQYESGVKIETVSSEKYDQRQLEEAQVYSVHSSLSYHGGARSSFSGESSDRLLRRTRTINVSQNENSETVSSTSTNINDRMMYNYPNHILQNNSQETEAATQQVQQDLFESLGVIHEDSQLEATEVKPIMPLITKSASRPSRSTSFSRYQMKTSTFDSRSNKLPISQAVKELPTSIREALRLPPPLPDLGELSIDMSRSSFFRNFRTGTERRADPILWRPLGNMVAELREHKSSVNKLSVSRDNLFMVSASNDSTVKLWECKKFASAVTLNSQLTYSSQKGRILDVTVCDSSHSIASCSDDGSVHVFKAEYATSDDINSTYVGISMIKNVDVVEEGAVMRVEHFNNMTESLLVYATKKGYIHAWDLRAQRQAWKMTLDPSLGLCSALICGPSPYSLIAGTSRGFVSVWDLRFQIPVQLWRHSSQSQISHLHSMDASSSFSVSEKTKSSSLNNITNPGNCLPQHSVGGPLLYISAQGCNEFSAFDIYSGECRETFRVNSKIDHASFRTTSLSMKSNEIRVPSLRSYGSSKLQKAPLDDMFISEVSHSLASFGQEKPAINGILTCQDSFIISAGSDKVIRYWDLKNVADSYRVSAPDSSAAKLNISYSSSIDSSVSVVEEVSTIYEADVATKANSNKFHATKRSGAQAAPTFHHDIITDLKAIEGTQNMLATSSRDGCIKIWV